MKYIPANDAVVTKIKNFHRAFNKKTLNIVISVTHKQQWIYQLTFNGFGVEK
jgi:hypothetical protein